MLKIRALNEPHCSSESEDEENPRLSKEAQESNAISLYNEALRFQQKSEPQEAVNIFLRILNLPYLNEIENTSLSPLQTQTRLGCLKCLSSLYTSGPTKDLSQALDIFELLTELEPTNVNNWYRYGKVAMELGDVRLAFDAFQWAHSCSNGHWGCIDKLITLSYVLHDMSSCLKYCAMGLVKDPAFVKALVFRDYVFEKNPWIENVLQSKRQGFESLFIGAKRSIDDSVKNKYLNEVRAMLKNYTERQILLREQEKEAERTTVVTCPYHLKSINFRELCSTVIAFEKYIKELGNLLCPADLSGILPLVSQSSESFNGSTIENGDEQCESSGILRSRSSSDDKEPGTSYSDGGNGGPSGGIDNEDKSAEDDSQNDKDPNNMIQIEGTDEDSAQKRKARKDVKWWQLEGKRRSQRVRGNMMPASANKPKTENSFAETLRNVIPPVLLINEHSNPLKDKENSKSPQKRPAPHPLPNIYFGTTREAEDVKKFVSECGNNDITTIISKLIRLLCREFKGNWPIGLEDLFLEMFNSYRSTTHILKNESNNYCEISNENISNEKPSDIFKLGDEAYISLTAAELLMNSSKVTDTVNSVMYECLEIADKHSTYDSEYVLRKMWMQIKHYFKLCKAELMDYSVVQQLLRSMIEILNQHPKTYGWYAATQTDYRISMETIEEKIVVAEKMEKLNKINELYQEKNYEALVDILQFSLTTGDGDLKNLYYLAESYYHLGQVSCVEQCATVIEKGIRTVSNEVLQQSVVLLGKIWDDMKETLSLIEYKLITNALLQLLIYYEKRSIDQEFLMTEPWCLLHSVLLHLEQKDAAFYIEEDSVPNSVLLLQLGHEFLSGLGKCCAEDGKLLSYTMDVLLKLQGFEDYWAHEETKTCWDQSILCLFSHPNKKYKLKNVKDHGAVGVNLSWKVCLQLYQYYKLEELPEFDSYGSISVEVENLFQRIIQEIPENLVATECFKEMTEFVDGKSCSKPEIPYNIPSDISDMYYLIADFHLKNKDFQKAVEFYIWDLAVRPHRFDSWAAVALSKAEEIYSKLNSCDRFCIEDLTSKAQAVVTCFRTALLLDETNSKVRIEFGSFLYALHSIFSRELKFHTHQFSMEMFEVIEEKKNEYLLDAKMWFEPHKTINGAEPDNLEEGQNEEGWINHYMLGKVTEKLHPNDAEVFLKQYELAGKLLHAQGAPYPARINYYNAPDFALEALEIYYRIHASILSYVERTDYCEDTENVLISFLQRAEISPFVKSKQGRGGENSESKRKKSGDESVSKKDLAEINDLMNELLGKVEQIQPKTDSESSTNDSFDSATATTEDDSSVEFPIGPDTSRQTTAMSSFSLSAFKDKMKEKEERQTKIAEEANKPVIAEIVVKKIIQEKKTEVRLDSLINNPFYPDFTTVKYGKVVSYCLKAMKECIARYPQSFKAYYRIAYCYKMFTKDLKKAREYLMGNNVTGANKILGLYGERKPTNFFNGVWRNPSDDIDRPGSFPFHMAKSVQLLLSISEELYDHQLLAELGIQLAKIPDSHNTYLFTEDREQFSKEAIKSCVTAAKKSIPSDGHKLVDCGSRVYDTYTKFQKHTPRENVIAPVLLDLYRKYALTQIPSINTNTILISDAIKYFQHLAWTNKTNAVPQKSLSCGNKQAESSRKNVTDEKTGSSSNVSSTPNEDIKRSTLRKSTSQRRMSDQERLSANEPAAQQRSTAVQGSNPVPSLLSTMELGTLGLPRAEMSADLLAYANQLNNYFASLPPMTDDHRSSKHPPSQTQSVAQTSTQAAKFNKPNVTNIKRDKPQTSNVPNLISFTPPENLPSVNQLISNVTKAIAASFGSSQFIADKKATVKSRGNEKMPVVDRKNYSVDNFNNRLPMNKATSQPTTSSDKNAIRFVDHKVAQGITVPVKQTMVSSKADSSNKLPQRNSLNSFVGPKVVCPAKLQTIVKRPINYTKPCHNKTYHAIGSRPLINTSPFQTQTTAMHKPSISNFPQGSPRTENVLSSRIPPAAHYQASYNSRPSSFENEQEVVDLTTKSPEKLPSADTSAMGLKFIPKQRPMKRPISSLNIVKERYYPLPPKKKHHIMPRSPVNVEQHGSDVEVITIE